MRFFRAPRILQKLFPGLLWRVKTGRKEIYLTFDDGPTIELTQWIADKLREYDAKGSFFCVGENLEKHPGWMEKLRAEGHMVANHTYNHLNAWKNPADGYMENVGRCEEITRNKIFRPPYGLFTLKLLRLLEKDNYRVIMWDVMPYDFDAELNPETAFKNVLQYTRPGSIIVLHDNVKAAQSMKFLLTNILAHYSKEGYSFPALS